MKVSYSFVKGRVSPHCVTWVYRKKRHRKFFKSRVDAMIFRHEKESESAQGATSSVDNEFIFHFLADLNQKFGELMQRLDSLEKSSLEMERLLAEIRKPPAPKILRVREAAKVLRVSSRKLYYLLEKGVFKRYKLPHTRSTFIKLDEVEKALGSKSIDGLVD